MPLSQKHRSTIYQRLEPILGEEEAEALLSQFPAHEIDELATKEFIRAEIAVLRTELHTEISSVRHEIAELRTELRTELHTEVASVRHEIAELRTELHTEISSVRHEIAELRTEMHQLANRALVSLSAVMIAAIGLAVTLTRLG